MASNRNSGDGSLRRLRQALRRVGRLGRKLGFYLLPPAVYDAARTPYRSFIPRAFRSDENGPIRTAVRRLLRRPLDPAWLDPVAVERMYRTYYQLPESNDAEVRNKLAALRELIGFVRYDRIRTFREMARLEERLGNDRMAAIYRIRCMRLADDDVWGDLPWTRGILDKLGFTAESATLQAMYGPVAERDAACDALIRSSRERLFRPPQLSQEYTIWDDRRGDLRPRVSVLVTVYNTGPKLSHFLGALQLQNLHRRGEMELVIVDSNSPTDEYRAFQNVRLTDPIPTLFARTKDRETIQTAWNRALGLARGPYVSLLGVDEAIVPHCFDRLASVLDADPTVDWVQGHVLSTLSDEDGNQDEDQLTYDKTGYCNDLAYLDSTYLGPVGALMRKSMFDRVGYFDGSFRGAGDTEFKSRALRDLKVVTVPDLLGLYINYPEERVTQSPNSEFEDLRAWYLYRTRAGVRYCYEFAPIEELEQQVLRCLGYRRSARHHAVAPAPPLPQRLSSDFFYAESALRVLAERSPDSRILKTLNPGVERICGAFRKLDLLESITASGWKQEMRRWWGEIRSVQEDHKRQPDIDAGLDYFGRQDNSFEQHNWLW